ncbi:sulfur carrier protein ThiS [Candidatus Methylocalor cossyra]|uniref:Sulfur carrier protein ThiS n=1 Tax=Candidatus Methylocalor cossyra TaxID=3108543 RepID=A0ABM9NL17_9GAMM
MNERTMRITINQESFELPEGATLAEAIAAFEAQPPFAVALNRQFVHRHRYGQTTLQPGDRIEIVQPVAGG